MIKKIFVLAAAAAGSLLMSGCSGILFTVSLTDHVLVSGSSTSLTLKECSLIFMDYQTRYNIYYENLESDNFWEEEAGESDFSDYLRDGRIKEEICALVLLNDMSFGVDVSLTGEEKEICRQAAADYFNSLSQLEKDYVQAGESDVASLYEKYRIAEKTIDVLSAGVEREISDNNKRVIILQLTACSSRTQIEEAQARILSGEDFETVAKQTSILSQVEYQVSRGTLNPILEETAFYMSDGDVSDIIQTEDNYYILKCVDDFDEELSEANEESVLAKVRYEAWSDAFLEYAAEHTVAISEELWTNIRFSMTSALTSDDLYDTYNLYFH